MTTPKIIQPMTPLADIEAAIESVRGPFTATHHDDHPPANITLDVDTLRRQIEAGERDAVVGMLMTAGLPEEMAVSWYEEALRRYLRHVYLTELHTAAPTTTPVEPIWGPR